MVVLSSSKETVPVGTPEPGVFTLTVAVIVTVCPVTDGFTEDASDVDVVAGLTVCVTMEDVDRPKLDDGDVLIKVEACGVCHSDLHVADGDWIQLAGIVKKPVILGHEIAGTVVEKGAGVRDLQVGDRVGVPWLHWSCGECEFCREGNENLCVKQKITGVTVDGGFAEFVKAPASHATKIPENLSFVEAAPLFTAQLAERLASLLTEHPASP